MKYFIHISVLAVCLGVPRPVEPASQEGAGDVHELFYLGLYQEIGLGNLRNAITYYSRIADGPYRASKLAGEALIRKGMCFEKLGKVREASNCYSSAREDFPDNASVLEKASEGMERLYSRTVPVMDREKALSSYTNRGIQKAVRGELAEAREMFREAFKIDPDNHFVQVQLASVYKRLARYEDAILYYRLAALSDKYRTDLSVHRYLAECYKKTLNTDGAIEIWQNYLKGEDLDESDRETARFELELLNEASDYFQKRDIPQGLRDYLDKGEEHTREGKYKEARSEYYKAMREFRASYLPPYRLAFLYDHFLKNAKKAIHYYSSALGKAPIITAQRIRVHLALLYERGGDQDKAASYIDRYFSEDIRPVANALEIRERIKDKKVRQESLERSRQEKEEELEEARSKQRMWKIIKDLKKGKKVEK